MAGGKWFLPYKKNRINYEDVGAMPYLVQHDIGFNGDKLFRAVKWNGPNSGTFSLVGTVRSAGDTAGYGQKAKAADTRKAHAKAVADARRMGGMQNPRRGTGGVTVKRKKGVGWYLVEGRQQLGVKMSNGDIVAYYATKELAQRAADRANQPPVWMPGQRSRRNSHLGTGSRFAACVRDVKAKGSAYDPYAVCAGAGRKKYGKRRFQTMAARGLRRAVKRAGGHRPKARNRRRRY